MKARESKERYEVNPNSSPPPSPSMGAQERLSDERLDKLIAAYGKMSFERTYAELAAGLRELKARRLAAEEGERLRKALQTVDDMFEKASPRNAWDVLCEAGDIIDDALSPSPDAGKSTS